MVNLSLYDWLLLAEETNATLLEKLDPQRRVAVVLALVGLGLLGALLVVGILLGGRWARQSRPRREARLDTLSMSSTTPVRPSRNSDASLGETIADNQRGKDTKA